MAYKIHKRGAFVIIENTVNGELKELNSQFVQITKGKTSLDQYEVLYNGVSQLKAVLGDIQDANGVAYVEADWDIFRYEQCGSVNSSEVANPYPAPTTVEVDITSAQILAMNSSQIELLPSLPYGQYYNIQEVVLEYTHISTPYTSPDFLQIAGYGAISKFETILTYTEPTFTILKDLNRSYIDGGLVVTSPLANETSVRLTAASNPTLGDGTMRAIITYTTRTFGA